MFSQSNLSKSSLLILFATATFFLGGAKAEACSLYADGGGCGTVVSYVIPCSTYDGVYQPDCQTPQTTCPSGPGLADCSSYVPTSGNDASCTGLTAPTSVTAGSTFSASVTMLNIGTMYWSSDRHYSLGSQPQDNTIWGMGRVDLPKWLYLNGNTPMYTTVVGSTASATFNFNAIAPSTPGTYPFGWRMVQDGVEWFGSTCTQNITVTAPSCTSLPANANAYAAPDNTPPATTAYTYSASDTSTFCQYNCLNGYSWNGSACVPISYSCTSLPANANAYAAPDNVPPATTAYTYSASDTGAFCQYNCLTGYEWNGSSCVMSASAPTITLSPTYTSLILGQSLNYTVTSSGTGLTQDTVNWIAPGQSLWNWQYSPNWATVTPGNGYTSFAATTNKTTAYSFTPTQVGTYTILAGVLDNNGTRWTVTPNYTLTVTTPATCPSPLLNGGSPIPSGGHITGFSVASVTSPAACPAMQTCTCINGSLDNSQCKYAGCANLVPKINSFTVTPTRVRSNGTVTLRWNATDVTGCSVKKSGSTKTWSGTSSEVSVPSASDTITGQTTYTLTCVGVTSSLNATVNVVPSYQEF